MYKVFVNDSLICLSDNSDNLTDGEVVPFSSSQIFFLVEKLVQEKPQTVYLSCENIEMNWQQFQAVFNVEVAAGGKVLNENEEVLFIKRFGKWDLPKGKVEEGESLEIAAIREVEEECGVSNLKIGTQLPSTYHVFKRNETLTLKVTHWYHMTTDFKGVLIPQLEEDITEVHFFNAEKTAKALQNTYENIRLLFA